MKLLIVDTDNVGLSMAWRAAQAGHQVRWYVKPEKNESPDSGMGFKGVEKIDNWVASAKWADLIVPTFNDKFVEKLDQLRKNGFPVFGPTVASAKLEIDREAGMKLLEKAGLSIPEYEIFPTMEAALKHVKKSKERYVFKTLGDNEDKSLTYVSKNPTDLENWIVRIGGSDSRPKGKIMLQKFVEGIELGVSRFMGSKGWVGQWNESFEHKKLMSGNYGPNTGEMCTVAYFTQDSKLGRETLAKLEQEFLNLGHSGDTAMGFIIPPDKPPMFTEFTLRFGWPIENMMLGATQGDPVEWMLDSLNGRDTTTFKEDIGTCLVIAHADFPNNAWPPEKVSNIPIYGITRGNKKHIHPQGVKIDMMPDWDGEKRVERPVWNTVTRYALVVTGFGNSVRQSADRSYKTASQLHLSNMIMRDDAGESLEHDLPELHKMGYATHCEYMK